MERPVKEDLHVPSGRTGRTPDAMATCRMGLSTKDGMQKE